MNVVLAMEVSGLFVVFRSAPILLIVVVSAILIFLTRGWNNTQHDVSRKIPITIRCGRQVLPLYVSEKSVGKLKKLAAGMFHIPKKMRSAIVFRLGSKNFHDEMTWSDIHSDCELELGLCVKGGTHFNSIPVLKWSPIFFPRDASKRSR